MITVRFGPNITSTPIMTTTTLETFDKYQPGQRYHPRYSPPRISARTVALEIKWIEKALNRNSSVGVQRKLCGILAKPYVKGEFNGRYRRDLRIPAQSQGMMSSPTAKAG